MALRVYNTLTRKKEPFVPREPGVVRMYNCGPTVYGRAHIGNLRSFLFADVLRRWLEYRGYEVHQVMNITDVGHLTDDERDEGEDKVEAEARRKRTDPWKIARGHEEVFREDLRKLGALEAEAYPRATEHVDAMLAIIEDLIEKGHAYEVDGDVYFDVTSFPGYGKLSGNRLEDLEAGARIEVRGEKRHPADFALWKSDPKHVMKWESRFGPHGFPGWHIECSAMAIAHLGPELDVHTGGEDNVFPHHECEIAQSECHTGKPFARYWMHAKFLQVDGGKMSKSLGNVYTLEDVEEHGSPRALRYALIRGHYRQPLNFTWEVLKESQAALAKLDELADRAHLAAEGRGAAADGEAGREVLEAARAKLEAGMDDDLNVPVALSALFELRAAVLEGSLGRAVAADAAAFVERALGDVLGLARPGAGRDRPDGEDAAIQALVDRREEARMQRDWAESDRIRDELLAQGVVVQDSPEGPLWRRR